ncbi:uncharacterized protein PpBr36_09854 [Pyricularia pennisetigena]|uniref:uncharacterized protein n=1 Tax=Pyricularia pennisetigena TaxID=1578925 RepID=UPI0011541E75|nr:uncharacterized protein PpBr36_09854 [Pyricularia pennisetigena]TLS22279.1 hypothetical protein PpBr36_09854 [Pyricularia pennisetigena]
MLAKNTLILSLAAVASAQTFTGFTAGGISCGNGASATKAEVDAAMVGPKGSQREPRADNLATAHCNKVTAPLFQVNVASKFVLQYAFDKASNTYTFCGASTVGTGKRTGCDPKK